MAQVVAQTVAQVVMALGCVWRQRWVEVDVFVPLVTRAVGLHISSGTTPQR
ncbi:hypothetical protein [Synechococcus sp. MIT S9451]|uniref:hypothetical protein n=1 Tax=Synechococcus sp. MIT S9451 TaxID=3082543 RepID=UPI0039B3D1C7